MSVRIMSLVFEYNMPDLKTDDGKTVPDSTAKFVLLALADHANDEGEGAYPSIDRLCKKTSMSRATVCNAVNALRANGYTDYEGISKLGTKNYTISATKLAVQPLNSDQFSHRTPGSSATELESSLTINKPPFKGGLSEKEIQQANAKVTAILENEKKVKYQNRDKLPEPYLNFADLYHELTGQEPTKRVLMDWMQTFEEWKQEGLQANHIRAAYQHATRPEGGFLVGRPGSLTNTAVAMKTKMLAKPAIDEKAVEATRHMLEEKETPNYVPMPEELRHRVKSALSKVKDIGNIFPERATE